MRSHRCRTQEQGSATGWGRGGARCKRARVARERGRPGRGRGRTQAAGERGRVRGARGWAPFLDTAARWAGAGTRREGGRRQCRAECGRSARAAGRGRSPWVCTATFGTCASSPRRPGPPGGPPSTARRPGPAAAAVPGRRGAPGRCAAGRCSASGARRGPADRGGRPADAARGAGASRLTDTRASAGPRRPRRTCAEAREPPARRPRSRPPNPQAAPRPARGALPARGQPGRLAGPGNYKSRRASQGRGPVLCRAAGARHSGGCSLLATAPERDAGC